MIVQFKLPVIHFISSEYNPLYGLRDKLLLPGCYKWFQGMVEHWITLAANRCDELTSKAIEADNTIAVTNQVKFSTSAVDVTGFLLKLGNFWKNMEWPEPIAAYGFASTVMEEINRCAQFYVETVAKRLKHEDIFDDHGKFRASEKVLYLPLLLIVPIHSFTLYSLIAHSYA